MKKNILVSFTLFLCLQLFSQTENDTWIFGVGVTAVDFYPTKAGNPDGMFSEFANAADHWSISGPRIHATTHLVGKFALDLGLSFNSIGKVGDTELKRNLKYMGIDISGQYAFLPADFSVQPYAFVGAGYTVVSKNGEVTFNGGLGTSIWINDSVGLNFQGMYKHTSESNQYVPAHFLYSMTLIMRMSGLLNNRGHGGKGCYY